MVVIMALLILSLGGVARISYDEVICVADGGRSNDTEGFKS